MNTEEVPDLSTPKRKLNKKTVILMMLVSTCFLSIFAVYYYISSTGDSTQPTWSPDGRFIAYEFYNGLNSYIGVVDSDGKNKRTVAECNGANSPVWSPDSTMIAFNCIIGYGPAPFYTRHQSINIVGVDGSDQIELIYGEFSSHSQQWSPDGNYMVFVSNRDAEDPGPMDLVNWDVYLYSFNDGTIIRLTDSQFPDIHPAWSPTGDTIAYVSDISGDGGTPVNGSDVSGGGINIINQEGELLDVLNGSGTSLNWSPDGSSIAFSNGQRIYSIEIDIGRRTQLTPNDRNCCPGYPTFSPTWNRVAFSDTYDPDDDYEIYIINIADGSILQLTSNEATDFHPAWSPDGSIITFQSRVDNSHDWQIYTIAPDGSGINCLTCLMWE
jgi:Tol biopolymer transport system component